MREATLRCGTKEVWFPAFTENLMGRLHLMTAKEPSRELAQKHDAFDRDGADFVVVQSAGCFAGAMRRNTVT